MKLQLQPATNHTSKQECLSALCLAIFKVGESIVDAGMIFFGGGGYDFVCIFLKIVALCLSSSATKNVLLTLVV